MGSWATSRRHAAKATPATSAKVTIILSFIVFSPDTCSAIAPLSLPVHDAQIKDAAADLGVLQVGWCGNATSSSAHRHAGTLYMEAACRPTDAAGPRSRVQRHTIPVKTA